MVDWFADQPFFIGSQFLFAVTLQWEYFPIN